MPIDDVAEPGGFAFNGTLLSGKVKSGCIVRGDIFIITRNDKLVGEAVADIIDIPGKLGADPKEGDNIRILISRKKNLGFKTGDIIKSNRTSCK